MVKILDTLVKKNEKRLNFTDILSMRLKDIFYGIFFYAHPIFNCIQTFDHANYYYWRHWKLSIWIFNAKKKNKTCVLVHLKECDKTKLHYKQHIETTSTIRNKLVQIFSSFSSRIINKKEEEYSEFHQSDTIMNRN